MNLSAQKIANLPNGVEASILQVDARNPIHLDLLRKGYRELLDYEASIHGAGMTGDVPEEVIKAINDNILKVKFFMVGKEIGGIATSFDSFIAKRNPKTRRVETERGEYLEDFTAEPFLNQIFRKLTECFEHPNGMGIGTAFTRARIRQSLQSQIKEVAQDNEPMAGLMNKHGGVIGLAQNSRILELTTGPTPEMTRRFGANVEMRHLPNQSGTASCPNNFQISWFDGEREIVGIFTKTISTFTGPSVVRLQLTSNCILPHDEMLKEVLAALLVSGREVIKDRGWGLPIGTPVTALGGPVPVIRIHAHKEPEIVRALVEMDTEDRLCGSKLMVAAVLDKDKIPNQEVVFGRKLPKSENVARLDPAAEANNPIFDFGPVPNKNVVVPYRPFEFDSSENDNVAVLKVA